jgi:hypothetical protein
MARKLLCTQRLLDVLRGLPALVLVAAAVALPSTAQAAQPGVVPDLTWATSSADQDRTAGALRDVGARWVRLNANWADAEPSKGRYSSWWLAHYDRAVALARSAGARIVMLSYQSPSWASGSSNRETPPRDPADFARFMGFLANRYAGQVEAYEVWNEENIDRFWSTGPSAAQYTQLLKASYNAIKAADAGAKVVFGGTSLSDYDFIEAAYAAGAKGHFDVMSVHPYSCHAPNVVHRHGNGRIAKDSFAAYREVRALMAARDDAKPIWFTEFGWSTTSQSCGVSESQQADYLVEALRFIEQDPYVEVALWYNFRNNYWNHDEDHIEARYGLMRTDFSPKPAYHALKSYRPGSAPAPPPVPARSRGKRGTTTVVTVTRARAGASASSRAGRSPASGSRRARRARKAILGRVNGAHGGRVTLRFQRYSRSEHRWARTVVSRARVNRRGRFVKRLRPSALGHGRFRVKAAFHGGRDCERSASRTRRFRL